MKTVQMKKKETNTLTITVAPIKVGRGHKAHLSGGGKHADKRMKRQRTRGAAVRRELAA